MFLIVCLVGGHLDGPAYFVADMANTFELDLGREGLNAHGHLCDSCIQVSSYSHSTSNTISRDEY